MKARTKAGGVARYDAGAQLKRDREVYAALVAGKSRLRIADELRCSPEEVDESRARMAAAVTPEMKEHALSLALCQLNELWAAWWERAKVEVDAANLAIRINERISRLYGLDKSPRQDADFESQMRSRESSTAALKRAFARVLAQSGASEGKVIEGSAVNVDGGERPTVSAEPMVDVTPAPATTSESKNEG